MAGSVVQGGRGRVVREDASSQRRAADVSVPERGEVKVDDLTWQRLSEDPTFWSLKDQNVLDVTHYRSGRWALKGGRYVGRAVIGGLALEVTEKVPGVLRTLVDLGGLGTPRLVPAESPVTATPESTSVLVDIFLAATSDYLGGGQERKYQRFLERGAFLNGRLDVRQTSLLRARGMKHQAAFRRERLTADLPLNRSIYAALREVAALGDLAQASPSQVGRARVLSLAFSECFLSTAGIPRSVLTTTAAAQADRTDLDRNVRSAAALAAAVLDTAGFGGTEIGHRNVGRAWFVNVEKLFESAVRQVVDSVLGGGRAEPARQRPPLFDASRGRYRANPDIVISDGGDVVAVADAKYKDFSSWPTTADVHEIVAHAAAFGTTKAVLFYPAAPAAEVRVFGRAATGCQLWAAGLSLDGFEEDVATALSVAGLS